MTAEDREFVQKLLFWDYVEEVAQRSHACGEVLSVLEHFLEDMEDLEVAENYEMCQLYKDTLKQFKTEFYDIG